MLWHHPEVVSNTLSNKKYRQLSFEKSHINSTHLNSYVQICRNIIYAITSTCELYKSHLHQCWCWWWLVDETINTITLTHNAVAYTSNDYDYPSYHITHFISWIDISSFVKKQLHDISMADISCDKKCFATILKSYRIHYQMINTVSWIEWRNIISFHVLKYAENALLYILVN